MQLLFKKKADKVHSIQFVEVTASGGKPDKPHSFYLNRDAITSHPQDFPKGQQTDSITVEVKGQ